MMMPTKSSNIRARRRQAFQPQVGSVAERAVREAAEKSIFPDGEREWNDREAEVLLEVVFII